MYVGEGRGVTDHDYDFCAPTRTQLSPIIPVNAIITPQKES